MLDTPKRPQRGRPRLVITCGEWMPRAGSRCARGPGHRGHHQTERSLEHHRVLQRDERLTAAARRRALADRRSGRTAERLAEQLRRGERIESATQHHAGMRLLVEERLGPRPEGFQLSLVRTTSPHLYLGYKHKRGRVDLYLLSLDPMDYTFESRADNDARGRPLLAFLERAGAGGPQAALRADEPVAARRPTPRRGDA